MQVVGAVGFNNQRLEIPNDIQPEIKGMIEECFQREPSRRPTFGTILERLGKLTTLDPSPSCLAHAAIASQD